MSYQWYLNGRAITGARSATYTVRASAATRGSYSVRVTNIHGSLDSDAVELDAAAARYSWLPDSGSQRVALGETASFGVEDVTGPTAAVSYQWMKDGRPVPGATSATLGFSSVTAANAGRYTLVITTAAGRETTATRVLRVNDPGLLVYSYGATATDADSEGERVSKLMGFLVVDRQNGQGALILYGKNGTQKIQLLEGTFSLGVSTTGPLPGSRSIFHASTQPQNSGPEENDGNSQLWFTGRDALVRLSPTLSILAPSVLTGVSGAVIRTESEPGAEQEVELENRVVSLALSVSQTLATRSNEESLAVAVARIQAELVAKGYSLPAQNPE